MGDVDTQAASAAEDTAGGGVQVKVQEKVEDTATKIDALEEASGQCKEEASGCKEPPAGGAVTGISCDNTEGIMEKTPADNNTGGNEQKAAGEKDSPADSVPGSCSNEVNSPPAAPVQGQCATGVVGRDSDEQPTPEPTSSDAQEAISGKGEELTVTVGETNMEVISSASSSAPVGEQLPSGESSEGAPNPGTDGTGGQGDIGGVTESGVGQGLRTAAGADDETAANNVTCLGLASPSPSDTGLSLASTEGGDTGEIRELPAADTSVQMDSAQTDKTMHSNTPEVGAGLGAVVEIDNHIPVNTGDTAAVSQSDTTSLAQNDSENKPDETVGSKPSHIEVEPVVNEDLSETVSSMSYSAQTSPSEGSVTLDSPSGSSIEDIACGLTEAHIEGSPTSDNGSNYNGPKTDDDNQMVVIPSQPVLNGQDSAESASEESQSGLGISDPVGVASPGAYKPLVEDHKDTPEAPATHEQDIPDSKPELDMLQSSPSASTVGGSNSTIVPKAAILDTESDSKAVSEEKKDPTENTPGIVVEQAGTEPPSVVGTKTEDTHNSTPVPNEDVKPESDQDTASASAAKASLSLAQAGATSPDSSIASSGEPTGHTMERAIDPYSVALDDALGSSSFNTSFVSTDISTDPEHTDAESVCTEGDSPRDPDAALVSTLELKDIEASSSAKAMAEESKVVSKTAQSVVEASAVPSVEGDLKPAQKEQIVADQFPEVVTATPESASTPDNVTPQEEMESSQDNQPIKAETCSEDPSGRDTHDKVTTETTETDAQLASGQVNGNGEAVSMKKEDVGAGPGASDIERGTTQGVVVGEMPPGGTGTPTGEVGAQEDQSVGETGSTKDSTCVDTVTDDVSSMGNSCQTPSSEGASSSSPSDQDDSGHRPASPEAGAGQTLVTSPLKSPDRKLHSLQEATEMMLALGCAESELVAPPEVVVTEAPSSGKDGDEPDGSRLTQGDTKADMAPPGCSVVMRKKPTVRLAPQPATKDVQLQQKIDHEIKMRDGTAKLLAASKHPSQLLEAAKNLLTSNARMIAYMSELQRRKTDEVLNRHRKTESVKLPCKAKVALSDIRIPLMWRDSDHFKNKGDHRRFAVFCVLKIGTQIYDTMLLKDVDSSMTDLTFDDVIVYENMDPDFECHLEVYCHRLYDDHSVGSTPRRLRKKFNEISTSVGRSVGRRLSGLKDDPEFMANMIVGPRFEMIASATLTLADVRDSISIFDLPANCSASTEGGSTELPLFGNFCCRLAAQPRCMMAEVAAGCVQLKAGSEAWKKHWCMLGRQNLHTWSSEQDQKEGQDPLLDITITSDARVKDVEEKTETGHVVQLTAWSNGRRRTFQMALESVADRDVWSSSLQQHITDIAAWKQACDKVMDIEQTTPPNRRSVFGQRPRSSLYEETPWTDDDSPMTRMLNRLDKEEQERDSLKPV